VTGRDRPQAQTALKPLRAIVKAKTEAALNESEGVSALTRD